MAAARHRGGREAPAGGTRGSSEVLPLGLVVGQASAAKYQRKGRRWSRQRGRTVLELMRRGWSGLPEGNRGMLDARSEGQNDAMEAQALRRDTHRSLQSHWRRGENCFAANFGIHVAAHVAFTDQAVRGSAGHAPDPSTISLASSS